MQTENQAENKIVAGMLAGYGPKFQQAFPTLTELFKKQPSPEELLAMEMPIPGLGRYRETTMFLTDVTSGKAIGLTRFHVLKEGFLGMNAALARSGVTHPFAVPLALDDVAAIRRLGITLAEVHQTDQLERFTEHDTAAAGDLIKLRIAHLLPHLADRIELLNLACTSEDTMGNVFGLILNELVYRHFLPDLLGTCRFLMEFAERHSPPDDPLLMAALTHEQGAEPTTFNRWTAVRVNAIFDLVPRLYHPGTTQFQPFSGKMGGAIGDLKAHYAAFPQVDWQCFAREFVTGLGLHYDPLTDQCVTYAVESAHLSTIENILNQVVKLADDFVKMLRCPAQFFVKQKKEGQKGSSIMPNKSNPWQIEGAIAALEKAMAMISFTAHQLPRYADQGNMKRSYLLRDIGSDFMGAFIALARIRREMAACHPSLEKIQAVFHEYPGMSGSVLQTVLKRAMIGGDAYRLIQSIAINHDGSYANADQFAEGLEQVMSDLELPGDLRAELRSLCQPLTLLQPTLPIITTALAEIKQRIGAYADKASEISGLPEHIKTVEE